MSKWVLISVSSTCWWSAQDERKLRQRRLNKKLTCGDLLFFPQYLFQRVLSTTRSLQAAERKTHTHTRKLNNSLESRKTATADLIFRCTVYCAFIILHFLCSHLLLCLHSVCRLHTCLFKRVFPCQSRNAHTHSLPKRKKTNYVACYGFIHLSPKRTDWR